MALEIERRFLVQGDAWRDQALWQAELRQGYLRADPDGFTLRVRLSRRLPLQGLSPTAPEPAAMHPSGADLDQPPSEQAWLTLKAAAHAPAQSSLGEDGIAPVGAGPSKALERLEFEYPIPLADAEQMLAMATCQLEKRRFGLNLPGGDWIVDVFAGQNAPLVLAEVELTHADAPLICPPWCALELTGRHELSNAALARHPLAAWSPEARDQLLGNRPER